MNKKALIIVDVQNDFCPGGSLPVPQGNEVVGPLNRMVEYAREHGWLIVASRDWHPAVTNHFETYGGMWPVHCVNNTKGAEFHRDLEVDDATIISKATEPDEDGYSAFDGYSQSGQLLRIFLKSHGVGEVYVGGLATDYCVKATALDAVKYRFRTFLLSDAIHGVDLKEGNSDRAIDEMKQAGVSIITTREVYDGKT
ncbi:nicotinamidase [Patescibacteria group bacterium AH-259-L05]|nr:nicotinamidase [Patescibacteria group bacterium AH-259-L05]